MRGIQGPATRAMLLLRGLVAHVGCVCFVCIHHRSLPLLAVPPLLPGSLIMKWRTAGGAFLLAFSGGARVSAELGDAEGKMVALVDAPAQFAQWEPGSDDKEHWLFAATVPRDVLRVREDYKSYTDRVGKNWDVFFDAPGASVHAARGELASPTRHYCTNADCSHTFVPVRHSSSGLLKIFREWVRPGESGHGATVHAPSDTFNCPYWGLHERDPNAPLTDVEPSSKREFGYGGNWNDVSGEIVSYHVSKVLRMWIVPPGKIVSFGSSGFPEWFSEHFCTTRKAMRAYFHSDDKMEHARAYGWLQVHARARARHRHTFTRIGFMRNAAPPLSARGRA